MLVLLLATSVGIGVGSQTLPVRKIDGHKLTSSAQPKVTLRFDNDFTYAGSQSFVLYNVANAEQHFFVDADKNKRIQRLYWVQFEGYLPNNTHTYRYEPNKVVQIGHLSFIVDSFARNVKNDAGRPGSDGARARDFLRSKGFTLGDEIMFQRLVHLTDQTKRNELMIIYLEDLSLTGMTAAELSPGGAKAANWPEVSNMLLQRAINGLKVSN